jgi:hypothetical protein
MIMDCCAVNHCFVCLKLSCSLKPSIEENCPLFVLQVEPAHQDFVVQENTRDDHVGDLLLAKSAFLSHI